MFYKLLALVLLLGSVSLFLLNREDRLGPIFVLLLAIFWLIMSIAENKQKAKA